MVKGSALIEFGRNTTTTIAFGLGQIGMVGFRTRKPGEEETDEITNLDLLDFDVIMTFINPEAVDTLIEQLQDVKAHMIENKGESQ